MSSQIKIKTEWINFFPVFKLAHDYIIVNKVNSNIDTKNLCFYLQELLRKYCINIFNR